MHTTHILISDLGGEATDSGHLEKALEAVPGVQSVEIDTQTCLASVEHDGADAGKLVAAVRAVGYWAEPR